MNASWTEENSYLKEVSNATEQSAKADYGKAKLSLVPRRIIWDIAAIREYGNNKYPDGGPDNWRSVESDRYRDAAYRHFLMYLDDPKGVDDESDLPHLWHLACNIAFLCEMEAEDKESITTNHEMEKREPLERSCTTCEYKEREVYFEKCKTCDTSYSNWEPKTAEGEWIYIDEPIMGNPYGRYRCSECEMDKPHKTDYCPNCGAKMKGADDE